ncbi:TetR/AcrR family transcriptional regulator [Actinomadura barringtoniae]|uniref:TetR/AcrR family transcriptional regulator n=1 Tax=Actinomadura barringtoniae TaxID=1427535 RepID=A0A939PNG2_9ACTN|nr:TetR/AcrR family transcriptional regulator [Actinomadura barringtoniae]MBO2451801.1 TetR/AcrR family transcriptional regulator [Actinomadura barringtoniae]
MRSRPRTYGGQTTDERRADRRRRLVDAALEIWGDQGWAAVTMRGVCARAGLIDRYFYESFPDRDALLAAVWDQVRDETVTLLTQAIDDQKDPIDQLHAAIAGLVQVMVDDPRRARIGFGEHTGSPVLEQRRRDTLQLFTDLIVEAGRPYFRPDIDETSLRMSTLMGLGGFVELITAWHAGVVPAAPTQIIDHTTAVAADLAARYLTP